MKSAYREWSKYTQTGERGKTSEHRLLDKRFFSRDSAKRVSFTYFIRSQPTSVSFFKEQRLRDNCRMLSCEDRLSGIKGASCLQRDAQ